MRSGSITALGNIVTLPGASSGVAGSNLTIQMGAGNATGPAAGGTLSLKGGAGTTTGAGGSIQFQPGASATGTSGSVQVLPFNSTAGSTTALQFYGINSTSFVAFKAADTIASNVTWILPAADGSSGQVLTTNGSGTLSFAAPVTAGTGITVTGNAVSITNSGVTAGTYGSATAASVVTVNAQGQVTSASTTTITPAFSSITSKPTTLSGYGITDALPLAGGTMSGAINMGGQLISNLATPVSSSDAATKGYVDNAVNGLSWKEAVTAATTANITLSGTQTIDGIAVTAGQRVLVKNQTTASQNGIYIVAAGAWSRSTDATTAAQLDGMSVFVEQGTVNANSAWVNSFLTVTVGTDAVTMIQFAGAGSYVAGTGISISGNTISQAATGVTAGTYGSATQVGTFTVNAQGDLSAAGSVTITPAWSSITSTPTTVAGYGITNAVTTTTAFVGDVTGPYSATVLAASGVTAGSGYNTFTVDAKGRVTAASTTAYLTANQAITLSGDITGTGTTAITATLAASGVTAGTYTKVTVDAKGRVTVGASLASSDVTTALGYTPAKIVRATFTNATLTAGVLTITHSLGVAGVLLQIYDNSNQLINPDNITLTSTTVATVDLTSYGTLTGTYTYVVMG